VLNDDGGSCVTPAGRLDPSRCLSGRCDPFGARGLCTSDCAATSCPSSDACATFNGTPSSHECLRRCDAANPCNDPLLECAKAGQPGSLGFSVPAGELPGTGYCAPRRCDADPQSCAPSGTCTPLGGASYCVRNG
jgi:hypothetical protein